jgi:hypothetical protein
MTGSGTARTRFAGTYHKVLKVPSLPGPAQVQIFGLEPLASASRILYEGLGGEEVHRVADTADHDGQEYHWCAYKCIKYFFINSCEPLEETNAIRAMWERLNLSKMGGSYGDSRSPE